MTVGFEPCGSVGRVLLNICSPGPKSRYRCQCDILCGNSMSCGNYRSSGYSIRIFALKKEESKVLVPSHPSTHHHLAQRRFDCRPLQV